MSRKNRGLILERSERWRRDSLTSVHLDHAIITATDLSLSPFLFLYMVLKQKNAAQIASQRETSTTQRTLKRPSPVVRFLHEIRNKPVMTIPYWSFKQWGPPSWGSSSKLASLEWEMAWESFICPLTCFLSFSLLSELVLHACKSVFCLDQIGKL